MNKLEVIREYTGILTLVKLLSKSYSTKEIIINVDSKDHTNKMEQQLNFLAEFGMIKTIFKKHDTSFIVSLSLDIIVFYQNYFDDIDYILNVDLSLIKPHVIQDLALLNGVMLRITRMFQAFDRNHCSRCCIDVLRNEEIE